MQVQDIQTSERGRSRFETQYPSAPSLVTRAWNESENSIEDAVDILFDCVVEDKEFLADKMPEILRTWCREQISSHVSRVRLTAWTAPNYSKTAKSDRVRNLISNLLMDFPLIGGKRLGDGTKEDVLASAAFYSEQARILSHRGRWLNAVAQKVKGNSTVSQVLTEADLRDLQEKTNAV